MAGRQPVCRIARQIRSQCHSSYARRTFSSSPSISIAHNFMMPAMSPTMTEGNISSWKVKEGESFSAGDILLEIETDKASMDVEAQDDGVMAKIFTAEGSKAVKVGTRIAVLGDPDDDVSSLEIPKDESQPVHAQPEKESSSSPNRADNTAMKQKPAGDKSKSPAKGPGQNPKYPLYPSVIALIHENHIEDDEVAKIPATGPNNRLLKGDVLAYLGTIDAEASATLSKKLEKLSHLDLSTVKLAPQPKPAADQPKKEAQASESPKETSISLSISLAEVLKAQKKIQDTLGVNMPLSTFLARAVDLANDDLPNPKASKPSSDQLFNAVLGLSSVSTTSRGTYLPQIDALPFASPSKRTALSLPSSKQPDIFDILSGKVIPKRAAPLPRTLPTRRDSLTTTGGAVNIFTLTVPVGEEKRAKTFLERMKTILQIDPGRLVL